MDSCQNCGAVLREVAGFCPSCGTQVIASSGMPPAGPTPPPGIQPPTAPGAPRPTAPPMPPGAPMPAGTPPQAFMPPPPVKKGMGKGCMIAIVVSLVMIVLIVAAVIIIGSVVFKAITAPADVANNYVRSINEGNLTAAFADLTAQTQKNETKAGFEKNMSTFKGNISKWFTSSINVNNGRATIVMDITFTDGSKATWDMTLIKEDGKYKILNVTPR